MMKVVTIADLSAEDTKMLLLVQGCAVNSSRSLNRQ